MPPIASARVLRLRGALEQEPPRLVLPWPLVVAMYLENMFSLFGGVVLGITIGVLLGNPADGMRIMMIPMLITSAGLLAAGMIRGARYTRRVSRGISLGRTPLFLLPGSPEIEGNRTVRMRGSRWTMLTFVIEVGLACLWAYAQSY